MIKKLRGPKSIQKTLFVFRRDSAEKLSSEKFRGIYRCPSSLEIYRSTCQLLVTKYVFYNFSHISG